MHWLSFDVVAGAVLSHLAANRLPDGKSATDGWVPLVLGLVVFGTYTLDHLLDNRRAGQPDTRRHAFVRQHRRSITRLAGGALLLAGALSWLVPGPLLRFGAGMVALVALYFWGVSKLPLTSHRQGIKEPVTALIYTAGVWGSTLVLGQPIAWESVALGVLFYLLTFQSLLLFSHFEAIRYREVYNLARYLRRPATLRLLGWLTAVVSVGCVAVCLLTDHRYAQRLAVLLLLMALVHHWMRANPEEIVRDERFRLAGEAVFFLPGLVL